MSYVKPQYSKRKVAKAGESLTVNFESVCKEEYVTSLRILDNWRSSHTFIIHSMKGYFRSKAVEVDGNALFGQRLKRLPSILSKLEREEGMRLDRMEDIAGCRIVVKNYK